MGQCRLSYELVNIYVEAGEYVERVVISKSGQQDKPIILSAAPGDLDKVKIMLPPGFLKSNPYDNSIITLTEAAAYITINGFVVEGPLGTPDGQRGQFNFENGIAVEQLNPGIRITNNITYNHMHCGIKPGISGIKSGNGEVLVEGNIMFENGDYGIYAPRANAIINGNIIFNNVGYGIHSYAPEGVDNQIVTRNVLLGNGYAGILVTGKNNQVFNNTSAFNYLGLFYFRGGSKNNIVENNVFAFNGRDAGYDNGDGSSAYGSPSGNLSDHNLYSVKPTIPSKMVTMGPDEKIGNPNFIAPKTGDFREAITSPYQDRGAFAPPKTSSIQVSGVLDQSASISWTTDIAADSWIEYSPADASVAGGTAVTAKEPTKKVTHSVQLTNFRPH